MRVFCSKAVPFFLFIRFLYYSSNAGIGGVLFKYSAGTRREYNTGIYDIRFKNIIIFHFSSVISGLLTTYLLMRRII